MSGITKELKFIIIRNSLILSHGTNPGKQKARIQLTTL